MRTVLLCIAVPLAAIAQFSGTTAEAARPLDASKRAEEVMLPTEGSPRVIYEGFETSMPPPGWTAVVNNSFTWVRDPVDPPDYVSVEGGYYAACYYDELYAGAQDEHICFDHVVRAGDERLFFHAYGSTYWAVDPYQNYNFMVRIDGEVVWDYLNDNDGAVSWQWQLYEVDLTGHTVGQTINVCFSYEGYDGAQAALDAIYIGGQDGPPETCCPLPATACYVIDFNLSGGGVQLQQCEDGASTWGWGPAPEVPALACDAVPIDNVLGTTAMGSYPSLAGEIAYVGPFSITSDCWCLELCHYYFMENGYDGGNVRVSDDQGASWIVVRPDESYDDVLDSVSSQAKCVRDEEVFTGASSGFVMDCFNLSQFEGSDVLIGFAFGSDADSEESGWYIRSLKLGGGSTAVENSSWGVIKAMYR